MLLNAATGESVKAIVHNDHLIEFHPFLRISKTMAIIDLVFKFIDDSFDDIVSS